MKKIEKKPTKKKTVEYIHGSRRTTTKKPKTLTFEGNIALKSLANQPFKGQYKKESFPLPKERTFEEWILDLETINERNMKETHCVQVTVIQWNELKEIVVGKKNLNPTVSPIFPLKQIKRKDVEWKKPLKTV